jgi:hypothetical protein
MKLIADSGLWSTGALVAPTPLVAVLEVSGAVLSWAVDDGPGGAQITFTDLPRADWLWRVLGESGHSAVAAATDGRRPDGTIELSGVGLVPGSVDSLRRLALGHWLRRWWPASHRDGIAALDAALLDAEIAVLTSAAQDFFTDGTFDSDVAGLLAPHAAALNGHVRGGDPRVMELVRAATELVDDLGIAIAEPAPAPPRRDDYALAAGSDPRQSSPGAVAQGTSSLNFSGVPPAVFDAAENTVEWRVEAVGQAVKATVGVELSGTGSAGGIAVRVRSGAVSGTGVLDGDGRASFPLVDTAQQPITESAAWDHDWLTTGVTVGADVQESSQTRERVRDFARARLAEPAGDAFLAEILAAESDY